MKSCAKERRYEGEGVFWVSRRRHRSILMEISGCWQSLKILRLRECPKVGAHDAGLELKSDE